jgi:hypothetical protein
MVFCHAIAAQTASEELETVVVTGEQPGPGLWKVSKGDHVMWVLATYGPLPKTMTWNAKEVEARLAESQELLYAPAVSVAANIGLLRGLTLIPAAMKASKLPDDQTLKDVLPPETYQKWLALRLKYVGKDDDSERYRPGIAIEMLRGEMVQKLGLAGGPNVYNVVGDLRKKHKVPVNRPPTVTRTVRVENPRGMLKSVSRIQAPDADCFIRRLDTLEADVQRTREIANAWSRGNVEKLRESLKVRTLDEELGESCAYVLMTAIQAGGTQDAARAKKALNDFKWHAEQASAQAEIDWVAAAQQALQKNRSTFSLLSFSAVLRSNGPLEKLRALGYSVEAPL